MNTNTCTQNGKTYVLSDIHGCYDEYLEMLEKIDFGPEDTLYFLGDAIDRGPDGIKIMLDMMEHPNIHAILGNHEAMALDALPVLEAIRGNANTGVTAGDKSKLEKWIFNGSLPSIIEYTSLSDGDKKRVMDYMKSLPLYREIEVNGEKYILVHGELGNFSPDRPLEDYSRSDLVWERPETGTKYYDDKTVIVGHSPTVLTLDRSGKIFYGDGFIDVDCGCVYDNVLGCLCLDTMEEFYVKKAA